MSLPLCPCNSGKLYEECCYKIIGTDGERLFFKGAMSSADGKSWHPMPNIKMRVIVGITTTDKFREYAKNLVEKSNLKPSYHLDFINFFAPFFSAYQKLDICLHKSHGKGATFRADTLEVRELWKQYLFNGRSLLDFLGLHCSSTLGLKQRLDGLNSKKLDSLSKILIRQGATDVKFLKIEKEIVNLKCIIVDFIGIRNREKIQGDTILQFPSIAEFNKLIKDGEVQTNEKKLPMIKFIKDSFHSILQLTKILLNIH